MMVFLHYKPVMTFYTRFYSAPHLYMYLYTNCAEYFCVRCPSERAVKESWQLTVLIYWTDSSRPRSEPCLLTVSIEQGFVIHSLKAWYFTPTEMKNYHVLCFVVILQLKLIFKILVSLSKLHYFQFNSVCLLFPT